MMKSLIIRTVVGAALVVPIVSFAQEDKPVTRDQVKKELVELEKNGYNAGNRDLYYPRDLQAAEARVAKKQRAVKAKAQAASSAISPVIQASVPQAVPRTTPAAAGK